MQRLIKHIEDYVYTHLEVHFGANILEFDPESCVWAYNNKVYDFGQFVPEYSDSICGVFVELITHETSCNAKQVREAHKLFKDSPVINIDDLEHFEKRPELRVIKGDKE